MDFGEALRALKEGKKISRNKWNEDEIFLWMKEGAMVKAEWCHDSMLKKIAEENDGVIEALPCICIKTADNKIVSGWCPSQEDMFSEDWIII